MPIGRPSDYTPEIAEAICARLMDGESLRSICTDDAMPAQSTVYLWLSKNVAFSEQYACARVVQADTLVDECLDIVDDARNDWVEKRRKDDTTYVALNEEAISRARLRLDARKWMAGKLAPKKYGDKVELEHGLTDTLGALLGRIDGKSRGLPG